MAECSMLPRERVRPGPSRAAAMNGGWSVGVLLVAALSLGALLIVAAQPAFAQTPPAQVDPGHRAPPQGDGAGDDGHAGRPPREDEPGARGEESLPTPDADQEASPPSGSGCPYRGRHLELIVQAAWTAQS